MRHVSTFFSLMHVLAKTGESTYLFKTVSLRLVFCQPSDE